MSNPYYTRPDHPLSIVRKEVIDAARAQMAGVVKYNDISPDMADPVADSIVMALIPFLQDSCPGWGCDQNT